MEDLLVERSREPFHVGKSNSGSHVDLNMDDADSMLHDKMSSSDGTVLNKKTTKRHSTTGSKGHIVRSSSVGLKSKRSWAERKKQTIESKQ